MIRGYAASASLWPGQQLVLHVSTSAPRFRVVLYRWCGQLVHMHTSAWVDGEYAPDRSADQDWQWPAYRIGVPAHWPSGVYLAHLAEPDAPPPSVAMQDAAVLFVVRGHGAGKLLYKLPLATYNAYNHAGGGCYYAHPPRSAEPPGAKLSFRRPGVGVGGPTFGAPDHYDSASARQSFAHWDARFIGWLLRRGHAPEFCTDLDIDADPALLRRYRLLLSVGHDEYWSTAMRDGVERFIAGGGNAAFFSANLCWWRVHLVDGGTAMVCHQGGPQGAHDHWWPQRPEEALAGVSYRHGGGWWDGPRETRGFAVQTPEHWVFAGTGLQAGEYFGARTVPPLAGYECDGAPLAAFDVAAGRATLAQDKGFTLLAACPLDTRWQELPGAAGAIHAATMGLCARGGTTFTAATTDWAQVLGSGQDARVDRITANVIARLLQRNWLQEHGADSVVVFRALQLGDMLCAVPALRALRAALPHSRITLVGLPWARQFAARFAPYIDEFIAFPGHPALPEQPVQHAQLADFYAAMRARRFGAALQLHGSGEHSNPITRAFGARAMAGFGDAAGDGRERFHPWPHSGAEPQRLLELMTLLGAPAADAVLEFPLHEADERELAASGLAAELAPGSYVCIHPGARHPDKRWHPARFAQVADQIATEFDVRIVLTGTAAEAPLTAAVASRMRFKALDAASSMSLGAMAALMSRARLLVANDTGVSHLAAGLGLRSVVVFSQADMERWAPLDRQRHRCLWDPHGERVPEVLAHARSLLDGSA